jgi:hypothetical protein
MESRCGCRQIEQRDDIEGYPRQDQAFMKPSISSQPSSDQLMSRYLTISGVSSHQHGADGETAKRG